MSVSITALKGASRSVPVEFGDVTLSVSYRLGAINRELMAWIEAHGEDDASGFHLLEKVLSSWDLTDEQGQPIPVTAEAMLGHGVPDTFLVAALKAVMRDAGVGDDEMGKPSGATSGAGSRRKAR